MARWTTIRVDPEVWERLVDRQARLAVERGRHVSMNDAVKDSIAEWDRGESEPLTEEAACPNCDERDPEHLVMHDDEGVDCASCGSHYQLPADEPQEGA